MHLSNFSIMKKFFIFLTWLYVASCTPKSNEGSLNESTQIRVSESVVNERFGGVGFHVFYHTHNAPRWHYEEVFAKRWRELDPSFVRINDNQSWDTDRLDKISEYLEVMKDTDTEMYFTSWGVNTLNDYTNEADYVNKEVDNLLYMKGEKGFDKLNYFCMTNELSVEKWASLVTDLDRFKRVQTIFFDEFQNRDLDIKLLATDASPFSNWPTIEWAANNMDDITGVYGGHHYINSYDLFDLSFYNFFYEKMKWGADLAKSKNKKFIVGEFGSKQNSNVLDSVKHDANIYNNRPLETYYGIQVAEAVIAMINAGVYGCNYWTFSDFPTSYNSKYINKWGIFRWEIDNTTTKPSYYCIGLLTKFFRGPSTVFEAKPADPLLRTAAIQNQEDGSISIAVVNRHETSQAIQLHLDIGSAGLEFRKYEYNPEDVPFNYFGDLQQHSGKIKLKNQEISDVVLPNSLTVYTTRFDETPPEAVKGLKVAQIKLEDRDRVSLSWQANPEDDVIYYRIYRSEIPDVEISERKQIATTINAEYIDRTVHGLPTYYYQVVAVDKSGNSSE